MSLAKQIPILSEQFNPSQHKLSSEDIRLIILIDGITNLDGIAILAGESIESLHRRFDNLANQGLISWKEMELEQSARKYTGTERTTASLGEAPAILGSVRLERRPKSSVSMPPPPPFPGMSSSVGAGESPPTPSPSSSILPPVSVAMDGTPASAKPSITASILPPPPFPGQTPLTASIPPPPPFPGQTPLPQQVSVANQVTVSQTPPAVVIKEAPIPQTVTSSIPNPIAVPVVTEAPARKNPLATKNTSMPAMPLTSWEKGKQHRQEQTSSEKTESVVSETHPSTENKETASPAKMPRLDPGAPLTSWEAQKLRQHAAQQGVSVPSSDATKSSVSLPAEGVDSRRSAELDGTKTTHEQESSTELRDTTTTNATTSVHTSSHSTQEETWDSIDDWWALSPEDVGLSRKNYEHILKQRETRQQQKSLGHQEAKEDHSFTPQWRESLFGISPASQKSEP